MFWLILKKRIEFIFYSFIDSLVATKYPDLSDPVNNIMI